MNTRTPQTSRFPRPMRVALALALSAGAISTTHAQQINVAAWRQSTEYRAMKLQRELSRDMNLAQSLMLGSHNSYNSGAYGEATYANSQHSYSLSEQLDLGLRSLDLDVHAVVGSPNNLWLSHTTCFGAGVNGQHNTLREGLAEIRNWLNSNPGEVIFLNIEQHFPMAYPSAQHTELVNAVEEYLGGANSNFGPDLLIRPLEIPPQANFVDGYSGSQRRAITITESSLTYLRTLGRVLLVNTGGATSPCNSNYWPDAPAQNIMLGDVPSFDWCGPNNWTYIHARDFAGTGSMHYWGSASVGTRARSGCTSPRPSTYAVLYNNTSAGQYQHYGSEPPAVIREAVRAGMDVIRFDPVGKSLGLPGNPIEHPADEQMRATIWSWDHRYPPPLADGQPRAAVAVIQGDTARIRWENPSATMRYALQDSNGQWSISSTRGTFAAAPPSGATNFRVPGNGFEMQNLFGEMVRAGITQCWVNYHDLDGNGDWTHATQNRNFGPNIALPTASPVPTLVTSGGGLNQTLISWSLIPAPQTGRVLGVLPGSYPGGFVMGVPGTIVPAEHGHPVAIGRP